MKSAGSYDGLTSKDACRYNPCANGGICSVSNQNTVCACKPGFAGAMCEVNMQNNMQSSSSCVDTQPNCGVWANLGLCSKINAKDPNICKKSCGLCSKSIKK